MSTEKKTEQTQREKVKLLKPHTHQGIECAIGADIDVTGPEKDWLIGQKIIAAPIGKETK